MCVTSGPPGSQFNARLWSHPTCSSGGFLEWLWLVFLCLFYFPPCVAKEPKLEWMRWELSANEHWMKMLFTPLQSAATSAERTPRLPLRSHTAGFHHRAPAAVHTQYLISIFVKVELKHRRYGALVSLKKSPRCCVTIRFTVLFSGLGILQPISAQIWCHIMLIWQPRIGFSLYWLPWGKNVFHCRANKNI